MTGIDVTKVVYWIESCGDGNEDWKHGLRHGLLYIVFC